MQSGPELFCLTHKMDEVDTDLNALLEEVPDAFSRSANLQSQVEDLVVAVRARENNYANTLSAMREKCASIIPVATAKANEIVSKAYAQADAILAVASEEQDAWEAENESMRRIQTFQPKVKLDVGGAKFTTSLTTLRRYPDTMLGAMFSGRHALTLDDKGFHFIDRDGTHFRYILNFLRAPENFSCDLKDRALTELKSECDFFGLEELMFPSAPLPSIVCSDTDLRQVEVVQNHRGIWCVEGRSVEVCQRCFAAEYSDHSRQVPPFFCLLNFPNIVLSTGHTFNFAAQPKPTRMCIACGHV